MPDAYETFRYSSLHIKFPTSTNFAAVQDSCRRHLGFSQFKILTVARLKRVQLRRYAKFVGKWSNRCRDRAIFRFFKMVAATISKSVKPWPKYDDFSIFQADGRRHLIFSKF